jgi:hypothetical protein
MRSFNSLERDRMQNWIPLLRIARGAAVQRLFSPSLMARQVNFRSKITAESSFGGVLLKTKFAKNMPQMTSEFRLRRDGVTSARQVRKKTV